MRAAILVVALLFVPGPQAAEQTTESFAVRLDSGRELAVQLRKPAGAHGPLPVILLFGGFRRGDKALDLVHTEVPVIWATFNYPFDPPRKFIFPESLKHAPAIRTAIHETFEGIVKLHGELKKRPDVDVSRMTIVGASAGAPFAIVGAARSGIPGVILAQGFSDVPRVVQHLIERKYKPKLGEWPGNWIGGPAWLLAAWITWYCEIPDIAAHARQLKAGQKVLLITAQNDDFIPRSASDELWDALRESKAAHEKIELAGRHLRPDREGEVARILERALAWMEKQDLL